MTRREQDRSLLRAFRYAADYIKQGTACTPAKAERLRQSAVDYHEGAPAAHERAQSRARARHRVGVVMRSPVGPRGPQHIRCPRCGAYVGPRGGCPVNRKDCGR